MSPDCCIYFRPGDVCVSNRLSGVRPHCPWYHHGECAVAGKIGRQGVLSNQKPVFMTPEPAPTLMRFRA